MKTVLASLILVSCLVCAVATAQAFVVIHKGVKSLNGSEHLKTDSSVIGHRVNSQGQFVLVYEEK